MADQRLERYRAILFANEINIEEFWMQVNNTCKKYETYNLGLVGEAYRYKRPHQFIAKQLSLKDVNKSKRGSYYDRSRTIQIKLPDGSVQKGKIRVANHRTKLKNWNSDKFGISIVVDSKPYPRIKPKSPKGVYVYVYEYILVPNEYTKKQLISIIDDITNLRGGTVVVDSHYKIGEVMPTFRTNNPSYSGIKVTEAQLCDIICEAMRRVLLKSGK